MTTQSTRCTSEELVELEEWLRSKGLELVEKSDADLQPGEYAKTVNKPGDESSDGAPVWTVTWQPKEAESARD